MHSRQRQEKKAILSTIIIGTSIIVTSLIYSLWNTALSLKAAKSLQIEQSGKYAQKAIGFPKTISSLTFNKIPDIIIWSDGLQSIIELSEIKSGENQEDRSQNIANLLKIQQNILKQLSHSHIASRIIEKQTSSLPISLESMQVVSDNILNGKHTYIIILQNSNEIRASGGFMGSYAKVELDNGQITNLQINDIYEPDGQFTGFVEAPSGVKEYLSSGNGLRLPDSNWHPDFPTSAQTSLIYFALGNDTEIDGLLTINLEMMEQIMTVVGNIYLPDYDITVTSENLADVARVNRDEFFPGSQQKKHFLSILMKKITFELQNLNTNQQKEIMNIVLQSLDKKDIQLYSNQRDLQEIFEKHNIAGEMRNKENNRYLYLVESNVGINKANKNIERKVQVKLKNGDEDNSSETLVAVTFTNNNQPPQKNLQEEIEKNSVNQNTSNNKIDESNQDEASHLGYINYQRIITNPDVEIDSITFNNKSIQDWDEEIITNSHGEEFKQIGFIITIPEQESGVLVVSFHSENDLLLQTPHIKIQKQPGIPPTPYTISYGNNSTEITLEKDEVINLLY